MDKVLITLVVPSLGEQYDVLLPVFLTVGESIPLLTEALTEITGSERQAIFDQARTIKECGIQNSDCVYLF